MIDFSFKSLKSKSGCKTCKYVIPLNLNKDEDEILNAQNPPRKMRRREAALRALHQYRSALRL